MTYSLIFLKGDQPFPLDKTIGENWPVENHPKEKGNAYRINQKRGIRSELPIDKQWGDEDAKGDDNAE